jgi:heme A synthase
MNNRTAFARAAWLVLGYNLLVILWGAFVRATGSGAGCGSHWPLCNGEVVPRAANIETLIEYSHRLSSGLALIGMLILLIWAWRAYPAGHRVRGGAVASAVLLIVEALIGAGLVLLEYVADNATIARAYWMASHLLNTFLLLGALTLTAWWASGGTGLRIRGQGVIGWLLIASLIATAVLGAGGGVTALGDTLLLGAGISPEDSVVVATLVDLRIYHPLMAFAVGGILAITLWWVSQQRPSATGQRFAWLVGGLFIAQLALGMLNVLLRAPVWLQIVHLLVADLIWINLVLFAAVALAQSPASEQLAAENQSATQAVSGD